MDKPEIRYPCEWCYTIIGRDEAELRGAAGQVLPGKEYSIALSNRSASGKYTSLTITTTVGSEEERNGIFQKLCGHPAIKVVM